MDGVFCGLMPAGKLEHVRRLKPETGLLAFVGDGMNDAPSSLLPTSALPWAV
ncbi:MAG: hypothetical protein ACLRPT_10790 [Akkermansia muciniphila]